MTSLSEIQVGRRAVDFIRSRLECGHYLANAMLPLLANFADTASTFLPAVLPAAELEDFRTGGKVRQVAPTATGRGSRIAPVADAYAALADLIEKHLSEASRHIVVIENANAQRGYPYLASRKSRLAFHGDEVLHALVVGDSRQLIQTSIRESYSLPTYVGVFSTTTEDLRVKDSLASSDLDHIARSASAIFVGAYDGEGFLLLRKRPSS